MPLIKSSSKKAVSQNIRTELKKHPDMPHKQAIAIALSVQERSRKPARITGKRGR